MRIDEHIPEKPNQLSAAAYPDVDPTLSTNQALLSLIPPLAFVQSKTETACYENRGKFLSPLFTKPVGFLFWDARFFGNRTNVIFIERFRPLAHIAPEMF